MIFICIVSFISLILEGLITTFIPTDTTLFNNCFTVMLLIIVFPYLYNDLKKFYIFAFIIGLFIDITYTNMLLLNAFIYVILAIVIYKINTLITSNLFNSIIISIIMVIIYRVITYLIFNIIGYLSFDFKILLNSITSSLVLNITYVIILYFIIDLLSSKLRINKKD